MEKFGADPNLRPVVSISSRPCDGSSIPRPKLCMLFAGEACCPCWDWTNQTAGGISSWTTLMGQRQSMTEPRSTKNRGGGLHDLGVVCTSVCICSCGSICSPEYTNFVLSAVTAPPPTSQPYPQLLPSFQSHLHLGSCNSWSVLINKKIFAEPSIHYLI